MPLEGCTFLKYTAPRQIFIVAHSSLQRTMAANPDAHDSVELGKLAAVGLDDVERPRMLRADVAGRVGQRVHVVLGKVSEVDHLEELVWKAGADALLVLHLGAEAVRPEALDAADDQQIPARFATLHDLKNKGLEWDGDSDGELFVQLLVRGGQKLDDWVGRYAVVLPTGKIPLALVLIFCHSENVPVLEMGLGANIHPTNGEMNAVDAPLVAYRGQ